MSALHALTDALLATCGAGDIGDTFPPSDPQWKGVASRTLRRPCRGASCRPRGGRIANADVTLICEAPQIAPHRLAMVEARCSDARHRRRPRLVKATTNERLGFIGRGEGIAAIATASVVSAGMVPAMSDARRRLADRLLDALQRADGTLVATAESCTGGMIIAILTDIPGSSAVVDRGFVTYSNARQDRDARRFPGDARFVHGAVSRETRTRDGSGRASRSDAGIALSVTGIAGPDGGSAEKPVGLVLVRPGDDRQPPAVAEMRLFENRGRDFIRRETVRTALELGLAALCLERFQHGQKSPPGLDRRLRRRRPIDLVGALLEGLGEHPEHPVEHRAHHGAKDAAPELVVDGEIDVAAALGRGSKRQLFSR